MFGVCVSCAVIFITSFLKIGCKPDGKKEEAGWEDDEKAKERQQNKNIASDRNGEYAFFKQRIVQFWNLKSLI
jgi:hypothetical protein